LNCKGVVRETSNYIDGDLEIALKQEIERHLEHCEDCLMIINQTRMTVEIFCDSKPVELPKEVHSRLHEVLRRKLGGPKN
jgi:anti-sigma factor RsiW